MAKIHISDLRLRTIIGTNEWERDHKQDVVLNITIEFDGAKAAKSDDLKDTVNYKNLTKEIIAKAENSNFHLIEKLADTILHIILKDPKVQTASVCVDKPFALRFADSVAVEVCGSNK